MIKNLANFSPAGAGGRGEGCLKEGCRVYIGCARIG